MAQGASPFVQRDHFLLSVPPDWSEQLFSRNSSFLPAPAEQQAPAESLGAIGADSVKGAVGKMAPVAAGRRIPRGLVQSHV